MKTDDAINHLAHLDRLYLGHGMAPPGHAHIALPEGGAPLRIDLEPATVGRIRCELPLATLAPAARAALLRERRRVLAPGGELRLTMSGGRPDRDALGRLAWQVGLSRAEGTASEPDADDSRWTRPLPATQDEPLVSIVITAFNPRYYGAALASALAQTYTHLEVVVGDDCPDGAVQRITREHDDPRIRYTRNAPALGGPDNRMACFARATGSLIKFLNDDDLLEPDCVRRMAACLVAYPGVTLVTSRRRRIDEHGEPLEDIPATAPPVPVDSRLDGASVVARLVAERRNFICEPSTVMFRKEDLAGNVPHILSFAGRPLLPNGDVTMWAYLLGRGDAVYLTETLSSFRIHPDQMQKRPGYADIGRSAWDQLAHDATALGLAGAQAPTALLPSPLGLKPWWPEAAIRLVLRANAAGEDGRWSEARRSLRQALELVPGDPWLEQLVEPPVHLPR